MSASVSSVLRDDSPKDPKSPGTGTGTGSGPEEKDDTDAFPEGGLRAWLVAAGAASVTLSTLGYSNAYGVFQAYYQTHQLSDVGPSDISWIGGVQSFLTLATGVLGGPLFDRYGAWVIRPAAVLYVFGVMMTSNSTKHWHFLLAQGILTGASSGMAMFPAMSAVGQYFHRRRGAALGVAVAGSSVGAVLFPVILSQLLNGSGVGFGWSVRICGFVMAASAAGLVVFALAIGFTSGAIISGASTVLSTCARDPRDVGTYMGQGFALASVAAPAAPAANGALVDAYGGFDQATYLSGSCCMFGALLLLVAKALTPQGVLGKV